MSTDKMTSAEFRQWMADKVNGVTDTGNRKIKGAKKVERDGIEFDSGLESHMHALLTMHKIQFEFQKTYELQPGFRYNGEAVRPITYTVDFELSQFDLIVDTKGHQTQQGNMRVKMLKKKLSDIGRTPRIALPQTKDECAALITELLDRIEPVKTIKRPKWL
ncbi:DUF1064 domain-containing protein [Alistipes sp. OttesenSCG-928-L06]|nr:DUF1064 domain-containing protein [Alistipes sp. OttesenSCG-928-L06]